MLKFSFFLLFLLGGTLTVASANPVIITSPDDLIVAVGDPALLNNGAASDVGQGVRMAVDGTSQKYYNRSHYSSGFIGSGLLVTPDCGATVVTGLVLTSGYDEPGRDPASFSLSGSVDGGKTLTPIILSQKVPAFSGRDKTQTLSFPNTKAFTTYKLIFPTNSGGVDMQVDEADLLGTITPEAARKKKAEIGPPPAGSLTLWYTRPADDAMNEALPIGNGRIGGLIFGGVADERVVFNEDSLWTGNDNPSGDYGTMGSYQAFGDILLHLDGADTLAHYRRDLDLSQALAHVTYRTGSVTFRREYFVSHPAQVLVIHLTADHPGAYSGTLRLTDAHSGAISAEGNTIISTGTLANGLEYAAKLAVQHTGGTVAVAGNQVAFHGCDSLTVLLGAGTDYAMSYARHYRSGAPPLPHIAAQVSAAFEKPYEVLKAAHLQDYKALFGRVHLDLGHSSAALRAMPTSRRKVVAAGGGDPEMEQLLFQYGRYLLISCSRPGSLPANLQGLWNDSNSPAWSSDYHTDINIQMNYWLAETTNLSECHLPLFELVDSQLPVWRRATQAAPEYKLASGKQPSQGWDLRASFNTSGGMGWLWIKTADAWLLQDYWEHYAFTGDKQFLRNRAYPLMKETCTFWQSQLKTLPDGSLVVPNGWSPEHGNFEDGTTFNQSLIWDLFTNTIAASKVLNVDSDYRLTLMSLRGKLLKPKIGRRGQLQEWMADKDDPNEHHRHTSHLIGVFPGSEFTRNGTPDMVQAAKVSLLEHGNVGDVTEWSLAWRAALFARIGDGELAHGQLLQFFSNRNSCVNLYGFCPPMQIDGNFGVTAAIAEMLLQSQAGEITFLPALPAAWPHGSVSGLHARGGFVVDITWRDSVLRGAVVHSLNGGPCRIRSSAALAVHSNKIVLITHPSPGVSEFITRPGETYHVCMETAL
ncbi:MAG: glycoside hydrolase family 95 protein [Janthinobacterium lividum]